MYNNGPEKIFENSFRANYGEIFMHSGKMYGWAEDLSVAGV